MTERLAEITSTQRASQLGIRSTLVGIGVNITLAIVKATAGIVGHSYALIADAIESATDILSSIVVLLGLWMAAKPPDKNHPYGHGKFEPLAAAMVAMALMGAAILIARESVSEILTPHHSPAPFTLIVLVGTIIVKERLFRSVAKVGLEVHSTAVRTDAWHHRSDALTSVAAFIGISIAIIGGPGYENADDFAALIAAFIIACNSVLLLRPALAELLDTAPDESIGDRVRQIAVSVEGVKGTHKCNVRKLGFDYFVDLDVLCEPDLSIRTGHEIAHQVGDAIQRELPFVTRVLVHVEPNDDYGRRSPSF